MCAGELRPPLQRGSYVTSALSLSRSHRPSAGCHGDPATAALALLARPPSLLMLKCVFPQQTLIRWIFEKVCVCNTGVD